jgi:hypothetical protein
MKNIPHQLTILWVCNPSLPSVNGGVEFPNSGGLNFPTHL